MIASLGLVDAPRPPRAQNLSVGLSLASRGTLKVEGLAVRPAPDHSIRVALTWAKCRRAVAWVTSASDHYSSFMTITRRTVS